jgi:hypothetical protein
MEMEQGKVVSKHKKIDVIVTAARYATKGDRLTLARGYRRLGEVWSDLLLFERERMIEFLQAGKRIAAGRRNETPGDFMVLKRIVKANGSLATQGSTGKKDDLGVPIF